MPVETDTSAFQPPYMAWATFDNIVEQFRATGLPAQIDRSVLRSRSGTDQTQFLRAAGHFGFIDSEGAPTERFRGYVSDPDSRPAVMRDVLHECYPNVLALPQDATPQMLIEQMRAFGIEGDTVRKAQTFFLNAARFAEIPLSPHFKTTRPGAGGRKTSKRTTRRNGAQSNGSDGGVQPPPSPPEPLAGLHPAIVTLVQHLPPARLGERPMFRGAERRAWFDYARATFNLIYDRPDNDVDDS